ncbi:phage antirepressor KilAC domain-containing protein [Bacillus sp. FSL R9-9530]|uniref:phage antirepressor KilAC domain-containing protein n=1 Tax=Bacillus sp. FSL R9-9530 TaxID=2921593 RepID=UPI0030FBA73F
MENTTELTEFEKHEMLMSVQEERDKLKKEVHVLDQVGALLLLPDSHEVITSQAAEFYKVTNQTIYNLVHDHREEIESDGYRVESTKKLVPFFKKGTKIERKKGFMLIDDSIKIPYGDVGVFSKSAILRLGMLLKESEVAVKVRDLLINLEKAAPIELKSQIIDEATREKAEKLDKLTENMPKDVMDSFESIIAYRANQIEEANAKLAAVEKRNENLVENVSIMQRLIDASEEEIAKIKEEAAKNARKAEWFNSYIDSDLNMTLQEFCKRYLEDLRSTDFIDWLRADGILYKNKNANGVHRTCKGFRYWFENVPVKQYNGRMKSTLMITPTGVVKLAIKYENDQRLEESWTKFGN